MARVKCITMQRDETALLPAWLRYHGTLFGFDNLVVFDHGSTERSVVDTLRDAERAGVDVRWSHRDRRDWEERGAHVRNLMRGWAEAGVDYDFVLPLDCDEFLAIWTRTGLDCRRATIEAALDDLRGEARPIAIHDVLFNVPGRPGWFVLADQPKSFAARDAVREIDGTFRFVTTAAGDRRGTRLVTLHFRNKALRDMRARARHRFGDARPDGHHASLTELDEHAYLHRYDDRFLLGFPAFGACLAALGIASRLLGAPPPAARPVSPEQVAFVRPADDRPPVWFDGGRYLERNPDVAGADWPAALHYARHGGSERRSAPGETMAKA